MFARALIALAALLCATLTLAAPQVQVYEVPAGARPHDVAPAPDGKI